MKSQTSIETIPASLMRPRSPASKCAPLALLCCLALGLLASVAATAQPELKSATDAAALDQTAIVDAMRTMYVALRNDDVTIFRSITTPDFYAYERGLRFTGDELIGLIKAKHEEGVVFVWQVTEPEVHRDGDTAWITYVNRGSITDAAGTKEMSWLESAVLQQSAGVWRIRFLHSTRVP